MSWLIWGVSLNISPVGCLCGGFLHFHVSERYKLLYFTPFTEYEMYVRLEGKSTSEHLQLQYECSLTHSLILPHPSPHLASLSASTPPSPSMPSFLPSFLPFVGPSVRPSFLETPCLLFTLQIIAGRLTHSLCFQEGQHWLSRHIQLFFFFAEGVGCTIIHSNVHTALLLCKEIYAVISCW